MFVASHYKAWRMIGLHALCAVFYTAGYALREHGAFNYLYSPTNLDVLYRQSGDGIHLLVGISTSIAK